MDDKIISNTSYTSKDFQTIYPELLDLVKKLTNKWDPSLSNESDPGVILLKLNALVADKNNYNIDKNVLECFPASVTQEGNARKLYDSLGYKMHWYRSANTTIGFQLVDSTNVTSYVVLKALECMVTDSNNEKVYTILEDVTLSPLASSMQKVYYANAIEGKVVDFTINGSTAVYLDNIDNDLRLYFTEKNVAENGIFIKSADDLYYNDWKRVDNIVSYPLGSKVFEFGVLPNSDTCYIQFPQDIANLLGDSCALNIKYILSSGLDGNIKPNTIDTFYSNIEIDNGDDGTTDIMGQIKIVQTAATLDGKDPETVDNAYTAYKKTIGTFNTLVTRKDYENFANSAEVDSSYLVSNCVVADRTCDLNCSTTVQTWAPNFNKEELLIATKDGSARLNAYNIVLYALNTGDGTYESTFIPNVDGTTQSLLEGMINDVKAVEHDFVAPLSNPYVENAILYLYKNLFKVTGQLITYEKVTQSEAREIEQKVKDTLQQQYNARMVTFGEEVDYSALIDTITSADSRIKTVALDIPKYQIQHVTGDGTANLANFEKLNIVAKMILAGNVQLFTFDDDFTYDFGQVDVTCMNTEESTDHEIRSITTKADISLKNDEIYTLKPNEVVQLYAPNYITKTEYSTYVKYNFYSSYTETLTDTKSISNSNWTISAGSKIASGSTIKTSAKVAGYKSNIVFTITDTITCTVDGVENTSIITDYFDGLTVKQNISALSGSTIAVGTVLAAGSIKDNNSIYKIEPNIDYILKDNELIKLQYTDTNNVVQTVDLTSGTIINISTGVSAAYVSNIAEMYNTNVDTYNNALVSGQFLHVKDLNTTTLPSGLKCYFILNNPSNTLSISANGSYILQENEYFAYTNSTSSELVLLGSGTMLRNTSDTDFEAAVDSPDTEALQNGDINAINWVTLGISLIATEMAIVTIGEGATIKVSGIKSGNGFELGNEPKYLVDEFDDKSYVLEVTLNEGKDDSATYTMYADSHSEMELVGINGKLVKKYTPYQISSKLNISATADSAQTIYENQSVVFNLDNNSTTTAEGNSDGLKLTFNYPTILAGGSDLDAAVLDENGELSYLLKAYTYKVDTEYTVQRDKGVLKIGSKDLSGSNAYTLPFTFDKQTEWLIPVYITFGSTDTSSASVSFFAGNKTIYPYGKTADENGIFAYKNGSYVLHIEPGNDALKDFKISVTGGTLNDTDVITVGAISKITGFNRDEIDVLPSDDNTYSQYDKFEVDAAEYSDSIKGYKAIVEMINYIISNSDKPNTMFDWTYRVPNSKKVLYPTLSSSFWNKNHVCNMYTIPQIDFSNTNKKSSKYDVAVNAYCIK